MTRASLDPIFKNMNSVDKKHSLFFFYQFPSKCIDLTLVMKKGSEARDKILARQLIRTIRAERLVGVKRVPFSWMFRAPKRDPETGNIWVFNISGFTAMLESFEPIFELRSITFSKITVKSRCDVSKLCLWKLFWERQLFKNQDVSPYRTLVWGLVMKKVG